MKIPPDQNTRAEAMWRIIGKSVNFHGKWVVDLGCGTGDFLWRARLLGAEKVIGVDLEPRFDIGTFEDDEILYENKDINELRNQKIDGYEIAFCFSVLPYLDDIPATLEWMAHSFETCLIECQYAGDGPGLPNIGGDRGMMQLLLNNGFNQAVPLGKTLIEDRFLPSGNPVHRTIWKCQA